MTQETTTLDETELEKEEGCETRTRFRSARGETRRETRRTI